MTKYYNNKPHTSPEGVDSLSGQHSLGAVNDAIVGLVQPALLYHLILSNEYEHSGQGEEGLATHLVLDEKFNSLNGRRSSLGDPGSNSGQHEVLSKTQLLARHDGSLVGCGVWMIPEACSQN